ncbi:hypothetical protein APR08_005767 [Nocardia amikacinitolerans]|nr:hypothetical protein [Nocardia amikacinitolerans]
MYLSAAGLAVEDLLQSLFQACYDAVDYRPDPTALRRLMGSIRALIVIDDFEVPPPTWKPAGYGALR